MKRFVVIVLVFFICILLALWSPWLYWKFDLVSLFGVKKPNPISGLQVFSLSGELEVFLDNKSFGKLKVETSPFILDKVSVGEHLISLKRISSVKNAYWDFNKLITFEQGANVVVSYNLGPSKEFSEGEVIYTIKKSDLSKPNQLNIFSNISEANIQLDSAQSQKVNGKIFNQIIGLDSQHKVKISKRGFEPLEFTVLPESTDDRNKLKDYDLNIDVQLLYQPVEIN